MWGREALKSEENVRYLNIHQRKSHILLFFINIVVIALSYICHFGCNGFFFIIIYHHIIYYRIEKPWLFFCCFVSVPPFFFSRSPWLSSSIKDYFTFAISPHQDKVELHYFIDKVRRESSQAFSEAWIMKQLDVGSKPTIMVTLGRRLMIQFTTLHRSLIALGEGSLSEPFEETWNQVLKKKEEGNFVGFFIILFC